MLFYETEILRRGCRINSEEEEKEQYRKVKYLNSRLKHLEDGPDMALIWQAEMDVISVDYGLDSDKNPDPSFPERLCRLFEKELEGEEFSPGETREITVAEVHEHRRAADNRNIFEMCYRTRRNIEYDIYNDGCYELSEEIIPEEPLTKEEAFRRAEGLMADESFKDELDRIYSEKNACDEFYGFPVHYHLVAEGLESAMDMARLLVQALYSRGRIPGRRISTVNCMDSGLSGNRYMNALFDNSAGSVLVFEMSGNEEPESSYASDFERVMKYLEKRWELHHGKTLFILVENLENPGFSKEFAARVQEFMEFVRIREGRGNAAEARAYLDRLADATRFAKLDRELAYGYLEKKKSYNPSDVHRAFEKWSRKVLREELYPAYKELKRERKRRRHKKEDAYQELQKMIGLREIKKTVDEIRAFYRLQMARERAGISSVTALSRHMVFTGNPGSAKTTVARLIAEVLSEDGVIENGNFVECGRGDLVGKYVGWTAKTVKAKFREARGGVLFIDEAYSLLDNSHSFGDEAINTIVQEMENQREKVIVIFAGYPKPMEEFLARNEGMRSRIAFHLDFPDYGPEEMLLILEKMLSEQRYHLEKDAGIRCLEIFEKACAMEHSGNGRFVRNLLERAMMQQALRLSEEGSRRISKERISALAAADFVWDGEQQDRSVRRIGFM